MKTSVAVLLACMFLSAPVAHAQSRKTDAAKSEGSSVPPPPAWDHKGHIRLCANPGAKRCTILTIPSGITDILGVVSTKVVPDVPYGFLIATRKTSYLCATGIGGIAKLRCQRLPAPDPADPAGGAISPEVAKAHVQNTITGLLATRTARPQQSSLGGGCGFGNDSDMGFCEGPSGYDGPRGFETPGSGGEGGWDGGAGAGGYTDIGAADVQATYQALADNFVTEDFNRGMTAFNENWAAKAQQIPIKCETGVSQCREACGDLQTLENSACAIFGVALGFISIPVGGVAGFYCTSKVFIATQQCKFGCNIPLLGCIP